MHVEPCLGCVWPETLQLRPRRTRSQRCSCCMTWQLACPAPLGKPRSWRATGEYSEPSVLPPPLPVQMIGLTRWNQPCWRDLRCSLIMPGQPTRQRWELPLHCSARYPVHRCTRYGLAAPKPVDRIPEGSQVNYLAAAPGPAFFALFGIGIGLLGGTEGVAPQAAYWLV